MSVCFTTVLMSACVEYVTDMERTHTTAEGQLLTWFIMGFGSNRYECTFSHLNSELSSQPLDTLQPDLNIKGTKMC